MFEHLKDSCESLLQECFKNIDNPPPVSQKARVIPFRKVPLETAENQENNLIIDKLRKKARKIPKEPVICKTNLGEDLLTFTPQEYEQLKLIDQCQFRGFFPPLLNEQKKEAPPPTESAVERLRKLAKNDDILEEIRRNFEWGDMKSDKSALRNKEKKVEFVSRKNRKVPLSRVLRNSFQFQSSTHSVPTDSINSSDSAIQALISPLESKLATLEEQASQHLTRKAKGQIYMTKQRKEALFQCELFRLLKKQLGRKAFSRLQICYRDEPVQSRQEQAESSFQEDNEQKQNSNCEAEEVLQTNYRIIQIERKRVIQKLIC